VRLVSQPLSQLSPVCLFADSGVQHILCCDFYCLSSSCTYVASFSGLSIWYSLTFDFLRPVSCVASVASFSALSIFDCSFGIL